MEEKSIGKYDRIYGGLQGVALFTKPSTVKNVQLLTGKTETFVIQTARHNELGDQIFIECMDDSGGHTTGTAAKGRECNCLPAGQPYRSSPQYCEQGHRAEPNGARRSAGIYAEEEGPLSRKNEGTVLPNSRSGQKRRVSYALLGGIYA